MIDHLQPKFAKPCEDLSVFALYEYNFGVKLPKSFVDLMRSYNNASISAVFKTGLLPPEDDEFYIWKLASIGKHRFNHPYDLLVRSDYEHFNRKSIPRTVIVFGFDYRDWPFYLDLTDGGEGTVIVHENDDRLPNPDWADTKFAYPCVRIADSFSDFIAKLTPDPDPP